MSQIKSANDHTCQYQLSFVLSDFSGHWPSDPGWQLRVKAAAGRKRQRKKSDERVLFVYTPNTFISLAMIGSVWCSSWDAQRLTPASNRRKHQEITRTQRESHADRLAKIRPESADIVLLIHTYAHRCTFSHTHKNTSTQTWKMIQRTEFFVWPQLLLCTLRLSASVWLLLL